MKLVIFVTSDFVGVTFPNISYDLIGEEWDETNDIGMYTLEFEKDVNVDNIEAILDATEEVISYSIE